MKDFAKIARPLHRLTEANTPFNWDKTCQTAFDTLRVQLVSAPILAFPDFSKQFIVDTDASEDRIAGVLSQLHEEHVITLAEERWRKGTVIVLSVCLSVC